jgi:hypothetical protein
MTTQLSDLAEAIIEDKWILCSPEDAVRFAIIEYIDYFEENRPYLFADNPVDGMTFLAAINEIINHFTERDLWGKDKPW